MEEKMSATLESIQRAAMQEFLDKGFQGASLRQIVKNAGVTTGAFYGYFSSKEALFNALVEPHAAALMGKFMEAQTTFAELPEEQQPSHMGVESRTYVRPLDGGLHLPAPGAGEAAPAPARRAPATSTSSTIWWRWRWNTPSSTWRCSAAWGRTFPSWTDPLCHIIASGMFNGIFEIVVHDMPREQALRDVDQLRDFYTAGWLKLMGQHRPLSFLGYRLSHITNYI